MIYLSILFLALAAFCYGIMSRIQHGNFKWQEGKDDTSFWGNKSGRRKYKVPYQPPLGNIYYRAFKLTYREKFPLSATALVFLTDGFHMVQFFVIKFIIIAVVLYNDEPTFWNASHPMLYNAAALWATWVLFFNASYIITKK